LPNNLSDLIYFLLLVAMEFMEFIKWRVRRRKEEGRD
jgi:hypothetical protein